MRVILCFFILSIFVSCNSNNSKSESQDVAENKNDEKFDKENDKRDAEFLVNTTNLLYSLLDFTEVAAKRKSYATQTALSIKPDYQNLLNEIESYASSHTVSLPDDAPEKLKSKLIQLEDQKDSERFDRKWCRLAKKSNEELIKTIEVYGDNTQNVNLKNWLNGVLPRVRTIQDKLSDLEIKLENQK